MDIFAEQLGTMTQAAQWVPGRLGRGVAASTIWRWAMKGRRGHKLQSVVLGGIRYTSREALLRWVAAVNGEQTSGVTPSQSTDQSQVETALQELGL